MTKIVIPVGDVVLCDGCGSDYTTSDESGGLLFLSSAYCPKCAPRMQANAEKFGETKHIRGRCPADKSFADWVREIRGPDAATVIHASD